MVTLEEWSFLEKIFAIKLKRRTWTKLITLDTIHWYCKGPELTKVARRYDSQARRHKFVVLYFLLLFLEIYLTFFFFVFLDVVMEEGKRRAIIKQQDAAKKEQKGSLPPKVAIQVNPSLKKTPLEKTDHPPKKPKVVESVVSVKAKIKKTPTLPGPRKG